MNLRSHGFLPHSRANGPGPRAVIWVQGCSLGCPGCFNPETHSLDGGEVVAVDDLFQRIIALGDSIEGLTISGGEPLQQRAAVTELLRRLKSETNLSVVLFTGFTWEEVTKMGAMECRSDEVSGWGATERQGVKLSPSGDEMRRNVSRAAALPCSHALPFPDTPTLQHSNTPPLPAFLNHVDVLIAGRYDASRRLASGLRGSANKTMHFLTDRYGESDFRHLPEAEIVIQADGSLVLSGIGPLEI
jgi:hypothetical protein